VLAVLALWLAATLRQRLRATTQGMGAWVTPAIFYGVWALGLYALMPPNPDPVHLSEAIVRPFRALSLAGLVIFWAALGLGLALLVRGDVVPRRHVAR
jgi:Probable cobalt transporter subunit (CbtA)